MAKTDSLDIFGIKGARITESYLAQSTEANKTAAWWKDHKSRILKFDTIYGGNLLGLQPEENTLENQPYVHNSLKNSAHDIKRLAREARGYPIFIKEGEDQKSEDRAKLREAIVDTEWVEGGGARSEGQFYFDLIRGGFAAVAVYKDPTSDYPQFMRMDPAFGYPTVANGRLIDYLHVETMKERVAAQLFRLKVDAKSDKNCDVVLYFNQDVSLQAVVQIGERGKSQATITTTWPHDLGCVPVAFRQLESADGQYRGLLDQLPGPLMGRNRAIRLMLDYLEDMVHASWEEKGIKNADALPGPTTVFHHEEDAEGETFMRRTPPAAPASAVFGLVDYLQSEEESEGFQPRSRTGQIQGSNNSGSFVESTQGSLSSVVMEMQGYVADLRHDANIIAMKIDEKHLDTEKPLVRAVGEKKTYLPSRDIKGWHYHKVAFGAAAGMDRNSADQRVLQLMGAGLIDDSIARSQIDFIEGDTNVADDVDRMLLRKFMLQKMLQDPNITFADLAQIDQLMAEGKSRDEALKEVLPQLMERQQQQAQQPAGGQPSGPTPQGQTPQDEGLALEKGAAPGAPTAPGSASQLMQPLPPAEQIMVG